MAYSNSRSLLFQAQKPFSVVLLTSLAFYFLLLNQVNSADDLSFTFSKFVPKQEDLILQGDAHVSSEGVLRLTTIDTFSVGRALYAAPVHIWDRATGRVASFEASVSFVVKAFNPSATADGIAFFLAPPDTQIPPNSSGGFLGLFNETTSNRSHHIVAVEFDTYSNAWDPDHRHIGIDVDSIVSKKTVPWDFHSGNVAKAVIIYKAATRTLTASITYPTRKASIRVSAQVDLKSVLPEWVRVGFSAANSETEDHIETHEVHSWSFASSFSGAKENGAHLLRVA